MILKILVFISIFFVVRIGITKILLKRLLKSQENKIYKNLSNNQKNIN